MPTVQPGARLLVFLLTSRRGEFPAMSFPLTSPRLYCLPMTRIVHGASLSASTFLHAPLFLSLFPKSPAFDPSHQDKYIFCSLFPRTSSPEVGGLVARSPCPIGRGVCPHMGDGDGDVCIFPSRAVDHFFQAICKQRRFSVVSIPPPFLHQHKSSCFSLSPKPPFQTGNDWSIHPTPSSANSDIDQRNTLKR